MAHRDAAGTDQDIRQDRRLPLEQDRIRRWSDRSVRHLDYAASLHLGCIAAV
jgi:hypothetical protein